MKQFDLKKEFKRQRVNLRTWLNRKQEANAEVGKEKNI